MKSKLFAAFATGILLATAAFFGMGAYVTAWGAEGLPYGVAVLLGGLVAAAFAGLVGAAVLHLRGAYFAVITFGLGELVRHAITYYEKAYEGTVGRIIAEPPEAVTIYHTVLLLAALAIVTALIVIVLGGLGSAGGCLLGGFLLGLVETFGMHFTSPSLKMLLSYAVLIAVLLARPKGLFAR